MAVPTVPSRPVVGVVQYRSGAVALPPGRMVGHWAPDRSPLGASGWRRGGADRRSDPLSFHLLADWKRRGGSRSLLPGPARSPLGRKLPSTFGKPRCENLVKC